MAVFLIAAPLPAAGSRTDTDRGMFHVLAAIYADVTAPGDEWRRGGQVATLPGRGNGPELRNGAYHRVVGARRREPCGLPAGAAKGGPHVAHQARKQLHGESVRLLSTRKSGLMILY